MFDFRAKRARQTPQTPRHVCAVVRSCCRAVVLRASVGENALKSIWLVYKHSRVDRSRMPNTVTSTLDLEEDRQRDTMTTTNTTTTAAAAHTRDRHRDRRFDGPFGAFRLAQVQTLFENAFVIKT